MKDDDLHLNVDDLLVAKAPTAIPSVTSKQPVGQEEPQTEAIELVPRKKLIRVAIGLCHTPSLLKLRFPPVKGCRIQVNVDRYQVTYPVRDHAQSKSFSSNFVHAGSTEMALTYAEDWAWARYAEDVTAEVAGKARSVQMDHFLAVSRGDAEFH